MIVYLVRHGESEGNVAKRFQTHGEKLTERGLRQAQTVAQRFSHIRVDALIASTMTRAQQTAGEISKVTGKPITSEPLFVEIQQPSVIVGKSHSDQNSLSVLQKASENREDPSFHYSDEENYFDFLRRVERGLSSLEEYGDSDQIVVIAHGHVIRAAIGVILLGTEFSARNFDQLIARLHTDNTGISMAEYTRGKGWRLLTYNDHAHLLE